MKLLNKIFVTALFLCFINEGIAAQPQEKEKTIDEIKFLMKGNSLGLLIYAIMALNICVASEIEEEIMSEIRYIKNGKVNCTKLRKTKQPKCESYKGCKWFGGKGCFNRKVQLDIEGLIRVELSKGVTEYDYLKYVVKRI